MFSSDDFILMVFPGCGWLSIYQDGWTSTTLKNGQKKAKDLLAKDYIFDQKFTLSILSSTGMVMFPIKVDPSYWAAWFTFILWPKLGWSTWKLNLLLCKDVLCHWCYGREYILSLLNIGRIIISLVFTY